MSGASARAFLQPLTRSITEETWGPFSMMTLPFLPSLSMKYWHAIWPAWDVVGGHRRVRAIGIGVDRHDLDAGRLGLLNGGPERLHVTRVEQDEIDAGRDEIVDLVDLLAEIVIVAKGQQLDVRVGLLGLDLGALGERDEERIAERSERNADGLEVLGLCATDRDRQVPRRRVGLS